MKAKRILSLAAATFLFLTFQAVAQEEDQTNQSAEEETTEQEASTDAEAGEAGGAPEAAYTQSTNYEPAEMPGDADGQVTLVNVGNQGWRAVAPKGEGVHVALNGDLVYFEVDGRYRFDTSNIDSEHLPLQIRGAGRVLISQNEEADYVVPPDGADPSISEDGVTFTLNEAMASRISTFRAAPYPQMVGFINTVGEEPAQGAEEQQQAEQEQQEQQEQEE